MKQNFLRALAAGAAAALFLLSAAACKPSAPKEADAQNNISYREYDIMLNSLRGVSMSFQYEGSTIEMTMYSDEGWLYLDQFQEECCTDWQRLPDYHSEFLIDKEAYPDDLPIHFKDSAEVQWVFANGTLAEGETAENYLTVIAEQDGYITGYAVIYLVADSYRSAPEIIANKTFPMIGGKYQEIDRTWLDERIEMLISEHQSEI